MGIRRKWLKGEGRWAFQINFYVPDGRRVWEIASTFPNEREAKKAERIARDLLADRKQAIRRGEYVHPDDKRKAEAAAEAERKVREVTFAEFGKRFVAEYASTKRSNFYANRVRLFSADPHFGTRPMRAFTSADLDAYAARRLREVKASTVRRELAALRVMFKMAKRWGVLESNPAADLISPKEPPHRIRYLSRDEWERVKAHAPGWLLPVLTFAVLTGRRMKEVTGVRWGDFDKARSLLTLSGDNKTASVATVPLSPEAADVLSKQVRHVSHPYVFIGPDGKPLHSDEGRNRLTKDTKGVMVAAGLTDCSFHTLRHTAATWMIQAGVSPAAVKFLLGHSTLMMTERYVHLAPEDVRPAVLALASHASAKSAQIVPSGSGSVATLAEPVSETA